VGEQPRVVGAALVVHVAHRRTDVGVAHRRPDLDDRGLVDRERAEGVAQVVEAQRPQVGWEALTPTEHRVVELTAQGLTNPQIGEQMFITRATVKTHLERIYAKLGVHSRAELSAEAARHGPTT
jgi:DNA-binding CsgD family transcriptional regulator